MKRSDELTKIVLTGGPSSGKSSVIKELSSRGYQTISEVARVILEERRNFEATKEEIIFRQREIYKRQTEVEEGLSGVVFLDRGSIDVAGYSNYLLGYLPFEPKDPIYDKVFLLDRLPFVADGLRIESGDTEAEIIEKHLIEAYTEKFEYPLIKVPVVKVSNLKEAISRRADYILERLNYD